jgi:hypothetical protein
MIHWIKKNLYLKKFNRYKFNNHNNYQFKIDPMKENKKKIIPIYYLDLQFNNIL